MTLTIDRFVEIANGGFLTTLPNSKVVVCQPTENPAVYIDCETNDKICRFTYWQSGEIYLEGLYVVDERQGFSHHVKVGSEDELLDVLMDFHNRVLGL